MRLEKHPRNILWQSDFFYASCNLTPADITKAMLPFRSWSNVRDKLWFPEDAGWLASVWTVNSSNQLIKEGHEDRLWSKEFMKHVLPRFSKPGTSPMKKRSSTIQYGCLHVLPLGGGGDGKQVGTWRPHQEILLPTEYQHWTIFFPILTKKVEQKYCRCCSVA